MRDGDFIPGQTAAEDLSSSQYSVVTFASTAKQVKLSTAGDQFAGVLQNDPESGQEASVKATGFSLVKAGTSVISRGDSLAANSTGLAVNTTVDNADIFGIAYEDAAATNDLILALLQGPGRY